MQKIQELIEVEGLPGVYFTNSLADTQNDVLMWILLQMEAVVNPTADVFDGAQRYERGSPFIRTL